MVLFIEGIFFLAWPIIAPLVKGITDWRMNRVICVRIIRRDKGWKVGIEGRAVVRIEKIARWRDRRRCMHKSKETCRY